VETRDPEGSQWSLRHDGGLVQDREGRKKGGRWKSGGGMSLPTWARVGMADEVGSDAMLDPEGGEHGHQAATLDVIIHRKHFQPQLEISL
jgi:hypothetical protein